MNLTSNRRVEVVGAAAATTAATPSYNISDLISVGTKGVADILQASKYGNTGGAMQSPVYIPQPYQPQAQQVIYGAQSSSSEMPTWILPVAGVGGVALILMVVLGKKRR